MVDSNQGIVVRSANLGWQKVSLGSMLADSLGIPVHIENISNAAALGEKVYGSGQGAANLIYLNLSVGIGAGIIINNEVYNGAQGYAGEVGHMVLIPDNGPQCSCGQHGCFEAVCGLRAIFERIKTEVPEEVFTKLGVSKFRIEINNLINP